MKTYGFHGWETADIKDEKGLTPRDYYDLLKDAWCAETCAPKYRERWTPENCTLGQCSITAFIMQDTYGGDVYAIPVPGDFHCFNIVDGCLFDLASEQFEGKVLNYDDPIKQSREEHFAAAEKKARYELLKERLEARFKQGSF